MHKSGQYQFVNNMDKGIMQLSEVKGWLIAMSELVEKMESAGIELVPDLTGKSIKNAARNLGVTSAKRSSARQYDDGYLSMSTIGAQLGLAFPQWRRVEASLLRLGFLKKEAGTGNVVITEIGKQYGRMHDDPDTKKRWRVWSPNVVPFIEEDISSANDAQDEVIAKRAQANEERIRKMMSKPLGSD